MVYLLSLCLRQESPPPRPHLPSPTNCISKCQHPPSCDSLICAEYAFIYHSKQRNKQYRHLPPNALATPQEEKSPRPSLKNLASAVRLGVSVKPRNTVPKWCIDNHPCTQAAQAPTLHGLAVRADMLQGFCAARGLCRKGFVLQGFWAARVLRSKGFVPQGFWAARVLYCKEISVTLKSPSKVSSLG